MAKNHMPSMRVNSNNVIVSRKVLYVMRFVCVRSAIRRKMPLHNNVPAMFSLRVNLPNHPTIKEERNNAMKTYVCLIFKNVRAVHVVLRMNKKSNILLAMINPDTPNDPKNPLMNVIYGRGNCVSNDPSGK